MTSPSIVAEEVTWEAAADVLSAIRRAVFVVEQGVPEELEWDGIDPKCVHLLARLQDGTPVATARMQRDGHIGRMAVLAPWRRMGVGSALLRELIRIAAGWGLSCVRLHAQLHALSFYAERGFRAEGKRFIEAGIPHQRMTYCLSGPLASR